MGELINLRRARKSKIRGEKEAQAMQNRAHFGRSASEKTLLGKQIERNNKQLDAHLLPSSNKPLT